MSSAMSSSWWVIYTQINQWDPHLEGLPHHPPQSHCLWLGPGIYRLGLDRSKVLGGAIGCELSSGYD